MEHSEPFEHEPTLSDSDFNKLQTLGKGLLYSMLTIAASLCGFIIIS